MKMKKNAKEVDNIIGEDGWRILSISIVE